MARRSWPQRLKRFCCWILGLLGLLLLVRLVLFHGPVRPPEDLPTGGFTDVHVHAAGIGEGSDCFISRAMQDSFKFDLYLSSFSVDQDQLREHGDALLVERLAATVRKSRWVNQAVVLALDGIMLDDGTLDRERTEVYVDNEFVARETARHEELLFGASVNPLRHDALQRLRWSKQQGAVLVKWLPAIQLMDPGDRAHEDFYRLMVELDLPLLVHTGNERSFVMHEDHLADPLRLRLPLELGVRVIAAHAGTQGENDEEDNFSRLLRMASEFDNLVVDISSLTQINKLGHLDWVLEEPLLEGRLLYGSDFPLVETPLIQPWAFPLHLTLSQMWTLSGIDNALDQDVLLKQALGVPADTFTATARYLRLDGR